MDGVHVTTYFKLTNAPMILRYDALLDVHWWRTNTKFVYSSLNHSPVDFTIHCDSSKLGWVATLNMNVVWLQSVWDDSDLMTWN